MAKKEQKSLDDMTREELLVKCKNQRENLKMLADVIILIKREYKFLKAIDRTTTQSLKTQICFDETMSLFDDIEKLKEENKQQAQEIKDLKEKLKNGFCEQ